MLKFKKINMKKISQAVIITILFSLNIFSQIDNVEFRRYTTSDGLSTNWFIADIAQDSNGYMWFASAEGLNRFDGYNFKIYRYDPNDRSSLRTNNVTSVLIDSKNRLWIGAYGPPNGGIGLWNTEEDNFINVSPRVDTTDTDPDWNYINPYLITSMYEGKSGNLWVGTSQGCDQFNTETLRYVHFRKNNPKFAALYQKWVTTIFEDSYYNLWVGTNSGVYKYNLSTKEMEIFKKDTISNRGLVSNRISSIYEDDSGILFVGTSNGGLHTYDYSKNEIVRNSKGLDIIKRLEAPPSDGPIFGHDGTVRVMRTKSGIFWLATSNGGIKLFSKDFNISRLFRNDPLNNFSLSDNFISSMFEDNQNNIWFGTSSRGLMKVVPSKSLFTPEGNNLKQFNKLSKKHIRAIYEDTKGRLWVGTIDGLLFMYDPVLQIVEEFQYDKKNTNNPQGIVGPDIDTIYEDENGTIWLGTFYGIQKYDPTIRKFSVPQIFESSEISHLPNKDVEVIIEKDHENLWVAIWDIGILSVNKNTLNTNLINWTPEGDTTQLSSNQIYTVFKTSKNEFWIGTADGLNLYDDSTKSFRRYFLGNSISSIHEDDNGNLWLGTNRGLYKFDTVKNSFKVFSKNNGFSTNLIGGILADDNGYLWIGTSAGLVRFDPNDETYLTYNEIDGSQSDLYETGNSFLKTKSGLLLFGGFDGITVFDPKKIEHNTQPPNVLITGVHVSDQSDNSDKRTKFYRNHNSNLGSLKYYQNELNFEYVGIHFTHPERNSYKYKLEPYDKDWQNAGILRSARYTNLDPGEYAFKVISANSDGVWSKKEASLSINIFPPWWKTWWAYLSYVFVVLGFLYTIRSIELKRQKKNAEIKESQLRAETAEFQAKAAEAQSRVIQAENDRKTQELEEARQLQLSMLPKELPKVDYLEIAVNMKTATEVGGDYYDFSISDDGILNVGVGDATGHGMQAGTIVTLLKGLFTSEVNKKELFTFLSETSNAIKDIELGRLMMAFSLLKIKENHIQYSSAGMPPMYIYKDELKKVEEIDMRGMPLGAIKDFKYNLYETELKSGDCVLLLSDGYPELANEYNEQIGYERLQNQFLKMGNNKPEEIIKYFKNFGSEWVNGKDPDDDVTFVVIKVK
jgi:ligand-binding sensor domain-containing protein/serine phosphatase RsbU (regulator of sigma subunit)